MGEAPEIEVEGTGRRVALVVARFNDEVTSQLAAGARAALVEAGVDDGDIVEHHVAGAFELSPACREVLAAGPDSLDAIVALGAVVRGETPHFDVLAHAVTRSLQRLANEVDVPLAFGVLTTETLEQAVERADPARAALLQRALFDRLRGRRTGPVRGFGHA